MFLARTLFCAVLVTGIGLAQSGNQGKSTKAQPKPKQTKTTAAPLVPPPSAEKIDENTYRAKEADGKVWTYRKTPFGWSRMLEGTSEPGVATSAPAVTYLKVTGVDGDTVRLEKATPFGASRWTRKKSELTSDEAAALVQFENAGSPTTASASSAKQ